MMWIYTVNYLIYMMWVIYRELFNLCDVGTCRELPDLYDVDIYRELSDLYDVGI